MKLWLKRMFEGFCMAVADSVPGVSGGSIAFLMGFYEEFITALNDLTSFNKEKLKNSLNFLIRLGVGWAIGLLIMASILNAVFESHIYSVCSLFMGFVLVATIMMCLDKAVRDNVSVSCIICLIAGLAVVIGVTISNGALGINIDMAHLTPLTFVYVFIAAMIAISAMVLPGISGSTLMLVFGVYAPIMNAVHRASSLDLSVLPGIMTFGLGVLTGIICFVRWIKLAFVKFPSQIRYAIIGMMLGSFYSIKQGPTTLDVPMDPLNASNFSILFFIIGALMVAGLEFYRKKTEDLKA